MKDVLYDEVPFPGRYWDADAHCWLGIIRLIESGRWKAAKVETYPSSDTLLRREIDDLLAKQHAPERAAIRAAEIHEEATEVTPKFSRMMLFNRGSHPMTHRLVQNMVIGGRPIVFYFKDKFSRPRPSQVCPDIEPLIDVPGHPAYPSGHSFQTHLIALALAEFMPHLAGKLTSIAERVAENREWAGVHYSSDSLAGGLLARDVFPEIREAFAQDFERAGREW